MAKTPEGFKISPMGTFVGYSPIIAFMNNVKTIEFAKAFLGLLIAGGIAYLSGYADWQTLLKTGGIGALTLLAKTYGIDTVHFYSKDVKING